MFEPNTPPKHLSEAFSALFSGAPTDVLAPVQPPRSGGLANGGATFPPTEKNEAVDDLKESPSARWRTKSTICKILKSARAPGERSYAVCGCGHAASFMADGELQAVDAIRLYRLGGVGGVKPSVKVSGTFRCQSPWLCPTCAPARAVKRQERLQEVLKMTEVKGGSCAFVTLTVSHKMAMSLAEVKNLLATASRKARQGRKWQDIQKIAEILGVVQGVEVLHNRLTGWHYHAHLLVPCLGTPEKVMEAMRKLVARFIREVRKLGGMAKRAGQDIQVVRDTDEDSEKVTHYVSKGSASWEIAGGLKSARARLSRTPWDLAQLANGGDAHAKALFLEYADTIVGTRSCVVSPALAKKLDLQNAPDDDDKMVVEEDLEQAPVAEIITEKWRKLMSYGLAWRVINAVEVGRDSAAVA